MSDQFRKKLERSSFGSSAAQAARRSVSAEKGRSLVARSAEKNLRNSRTARGEVARHVHIPRCRNKTSMKLEMGRPVCAETARKP